MAESQDCDDTDLAVKACRQDVTAFHGCSSLLHTLTINADAALLNQFRGKAPRFHKPRVPQPLVESLLLRCAQILVPGTVDRDTTLTRALFHKRGVLD